MVEFKLDCLLVETVQDTMRVYLHENFPRRVSSRVVASSSAQNGGYPDNLFFLGWTFEETVGMSYFFVLECMGRTKYTLSPPHSTYPPVFHTVVHARLLAPKKNLQI